MSVDKLMLSPDSNDRLMLTKAEQTEHEFQIGDSEHSIQFNGRTDGGFEEIAALEVIDGQVRFTGNADAAARQFFEYFLQAECDKYIERRLAEQGLCGEPVVKKGQLEK